MGGGREAPDQGGKTTGRGAEDTGWEWLADGFGSVRSARAESPGLRGCSHPPRADGAVKNGRMGRHCWAAFYRYCIPSIHPDLSLRWKNEKDIICKKITEIISKFIYNMIL